MRGGGEGDAEESHAQFTRRVRKRGRCDVVDRSRTARPESDCTAKRRSRIRSEQRSDSARRSCRGRNTTRRKRLSNFFEQLETRVAGLPGVEAVGLITELPLSGQPNDMPFTVEGRPPVTSDQKLWR